MRWFACPEGGALRLRKEPEVDQWETALHPAKVRLEAYLDDTEALIAESRIEGPWALRLDVGLSSGKALLDKSDLDNYAKPLAKRLGNSDLVSVWCTKSHNESSFVRLEPARARAAPAQEVVIAEPTAGWDRSDHLYHKQVHRAVAAMAPLPSDRAVRLELAFVLPPSWIWWNFWKPTIDGLVHLLGHSGTDSLWDPLDGRITELGVHLTPDPAARHVTIGIAASCPQAHPGVDDPGMASEKGGFPDDRGQRQGGWLG